jgi:hypothetical protein
MDSLLVESIDGEAFEQGDARRKSKTDKCHDTTSFTATRPASS